MRPTQVGSNFTVSGNDFGFDFNPTVDRIRITSDAEMNLSVNPNDGVPTAQSPLNPGNPNIVGSAYTNNFLGATTTTLYGIDSSTDMLVIQSPPANGTLTNVGALGVDTSGLVGFDISQCDGTAYAALNANASKQGFIAGGSSLYTINLASGTATPVGSIGVGNTIRALAVETAPTSSCSFTVTVNDTQPPSITCPPNLTVVTATINDPCAVANFTVTTTDNCPGVTVVCNPPSGSCFPIGVTTVTCTATSANGGTATCSFTVSVFDARLQDDSQGCNNSVLFNTLTGDYRWCCQGTIFTGRGKVTKLGNNVTLEHNAVDRRVLIKLSAGSFPPSGTAGLQSPPGTTRCAITDRDTRNDTCLCGGQP